MKPSSILVAVKEKAGAIIKALLFPFTCPFTLAQADIT